MGGTIALVASIDEAQEVIPRNVAERANKPHCCLLQP
jgi:hypothetical protein